MLKPIYITSGGYKRNIGSMDSLKKRFYKQVDSNRHKFRVLNAYGIDSHTLNTKLKDYTIYLEEVDTKSWFKVSAKDFIEKGQCYHFKDKVDHDTQLFLPISEWHKLTEEEVYKMNI